MNNRLEMVDRAGRRIVRRGLRSSRAGRGSFGQSSLAAWKDALRTADTAVVTMAGPAGVAGRLGDALREVVARRSGTRRCGSMLDDRSSGFPRLECGWREAFSKGLFRPVEENVM